MKLSKEYWQERYSNHETGWDIGSASTPLKEYIDGLRDKTLKILIPGCGNAYEAAYLYEKGFLNTYLVDFAEAPLKAFAEKYPEFPKDQLICNDFFNLEGQFDLILEQTFFCALDPALRNDYCRKMSTLLAPKGKLVGLLFNQKFEKEGPPFGGFLEEYKPQFSQFLNIQVLEECRNSIAPRAGKELFMICSEK